MAGDEGEGRGGWQMMKGRGKRMLKGEEKRRAQTAVRNFRSYSLQHKEPARVASLVEARPMVEWMAGMAASRGIPAVRSVGEVADEAADLLLEGPQSAALKARIEKSVEAADGDRSEEGG